MKTSENKILITGGAGFIGSHMADALSERGFEIRILDNLAEPVHTGDWPSYMRDKGYELMRGDVRSREDMETALDGVSYVYHIAAHQDQRPNFSEFFDTNTTSTALLYEILLQRQLPVKKVILASSQFVYGDGYYKCGHDGAGDRFMPELRTKEQFDKGEWDIVCPHGKEAKFVPFEESQKVNPTNSYGLSKYALEIAGFRLGKTHGIPTTALRYSVVQGPRQSPRNRYSGALRIFVQQALNGDPITVFEDGKQKRDFVNIEDVVAANLLALDEDRTNFEVYNVGGGEGYEVLEFAKMVKEITESDSEIKVGDYRRTDTRHAVSNISKLKELGWEPKHSPEKSVKDYVEWYRKEFM